MNIDDQIDVLHAADVDRGAMNALNLFHLPFEATVYTSNSNLYCLDVWPPHIVHMYYRKMVNWVSFKCQRRKEIELEIYIHDFLFECHQFIAMFIFFGHFVMTTIQFSYDRFRKIMVQFFHIHCTEWAKKERERERKRFVEFNWSKMEMLNLLSYLIGRVVTCQIVEKRSDIIKHISIKITHTNWATYSQNEFLAK